MRNLERSKADIRKEKLQLRKALTPLQAEEYSNKICDRLYETAQINECRRLLVYADYNNEVSTEKIILKAIMKGIEVYMPKVRGDEMDFYRVFSPDELQTGAFGIREPYEIDYLKFEGGDKSICLLPLSAFDKVGNRIGYGKGYYDKYLGRVSVETCIGLAYSFQECEEIPTDQYDRSLDMVITEEKILDFRKES